MKIPSIRCRRGFTLIELLVVISIIAVLAAAGFAAGNAAIQKARKTTALATATAIETAVNNFFTEYGSMPKKDLTGDTEPPLDTTKDLELLRELLGIATGDDAVNTRKVKFLSVREGKAKKNGLIYNSGGTDITGLYDPWGGPFFVILDGDYNERVKPAPASGGGRELNGRRAAVWSDGADWDKKDKKRNDDVITW